MNTTKALREEKKKANRSRSMQHRILTKILLAMLTITLFIGGISFYEVDQYIKTESEKFVTVTCEYEGTQINNIFEDMEKSVMVMESYILDFFTEETDLEDQKFQEGLIRNTERMFAEVAKHANGAVAYYFRFDPALSTGTTGLFYSKTQESDDYIAFEPTDLSLYDKEDTEHVGWFWQPYESKAPVWMRPYYNQNNNIYMISYVIPMYHEGKFIGVVGIDFDYTVLEDQVSKIKIYEQGFAHLEIDGTVIHSKDHLPAKEEISDSGKYLRVSKELKNGMTLVLSASYNDIRHTRYEIGISILFSVFILSAIFTVMAVLVVKKIVAPLKTLAEASAKLSNGDYNVKLSSSGILEIDLLNTAFENMANRWHEREKELRFSAHRDSLTGLRNATSYKRWEERMDEEILKKSASFGVVVFDLNQLKKTNDTYGHDAGNQLIATVAKVLSDVFQKSPVFRIGGDEFLAILRHEDLEDTESLFARLELECKKARLGKKNGFDISIARGFAAFDADKDLCFNDVFKRADEAMYQNKRKNKKDKV